MKHPSSTKTNVKHDLSIHTMTNFKEINEEWHHWFSFKLNDIAYEMLIAGSLIQPRSNYLEILSIDHKGKNCSFCSKVDSEGKTCEFLIAHAFEIYQNLLPLSKNRLRWVSRDVFY